MFFFFFLAVVFGIFLLCLCFLKAMFWCFFRFFFYLRVGGNEVEGVGKSTHSSLDESGSDSSNYESHVLMGSAGDYEIPSYCLY